MMHLSLWHWILAAVILGLVAWPGVRILRKAGYSGWWILLIFLPLVNFVAVWVFAYADWPRLRTTASPPG
jgi:predicted PurR-regulated permease PerM